jgi:hypothetical protein
VPTIELAKAQREIETQVMLLQAKAATSGQAAP